MDEVESTPVSPVLEAENEALEWSVMVFDGRCVRTLPLTVLFIRLLGAHSSS